MRLAPLAILLAACARAPEAVTVCAAASLREIVPEICDGWSRASGTRVMCRFASSDTLARQIREGAPCDVFVSADPRWASEVRALDSFPWLVNSLVCVRPKGSKVDNLARAERLALGSEASPVGRYAAAALKAMGIAVPEGTIYGGDVRDVLSKVAEGAAEAGIVYATDVAIDPRVEVACVLPAEVQPRIVYPVALLTERGRALYAAFRAPAALEAARRRGFTEAP